jgi:hypothetical protein
MEISPAAIARAGRENNFDAIRFVSLRWSYSRIRF